MNKMEDLRKGFAISVGALLFSIVLTFAQHYVLSAVLAIAAMYSACRIVFEYRKMKNQK